MSKRTETYAKNKLEENILSVVNESLKNKEVELIQPFTKPKLPIIFIVGAQRSGTTLLMQLLTQFFHLSYPTNFIARFWEAPYIGAMLYKNISKNNDNRQLNLQSDLGYTKGLQGPHEFGYFWKKWFPWESWEEKQYDKIDYTILEKELAAWENIKNISLIFKNLIQINYNINKLFSLFPNSIFIYLKRDLKFNIQSTYNSRIKMYNDENKWFGVKPTNYNNIIKLPVIEQIAKQIICTNKDIEKQLIDIPDNKIIKINYEDLISDYTIELNKIAKKTDLKRKTNNIIINLKSANKITNNDIFNKINRTIASLT